MMADSRPLVDGVDLGTTRIPYRLTIPSVKSDSFKPPRLSDHDGLSMFLPSNSEPDVDALSAWAGAFKCTVNANGGGASSSSAIGDLSVYSSDEFRMYEFKVRRCMRGRSHDWTDCPFAHPGEKARRRDPKKYNYNGTACPDYRKGSCRKGDSCEFSHGVFECWLHPARYRTQPCKDGPNCTRRICFFAHSKEQLRLLPSALAAAAQNLSEEADEIDKSSQFSQSLPASPQGIQPELQFVNIQRRISLGSLNSACHPLSPHHAFTVLSPASSVNPNWGSPLGPAGKPQQSVDPNEFLAGNMLLQEPQMYQEHNLNEQEAFPADMYPLARDCTWPFNNPQRRPSFVQSEDSFPDSGYVSSPLFHSSPSNNFGQYQRDGMDELMGSLQALDLRSRNGSLCEDREAMGMNPLNQYLQNPPDGFLSGSRRSFEVPRSWKVREDERLRRMAILGNVDVSQLLAQQNHFSDGAGQPWFAGEPDGSVITSENMYTGSRPVYTSFVPYQNAVSQPGMMNSHVHEEKDEVMLADSWGNPVNSSHTETPLG